MAKSQFVKEFGILGKSNRSLTKADIIIDPNDEKGFIIKFKFGTTIDQQNIEVSFKDETKLHNKNGNSLNTSRSSQNAKISYIFIDKMQEEKS